MQSSGLCNSTLIIGLGKEIRGLAVSNVYIFFLNVFIILISRRKKKKLLKMCTTEINLKKNVIMQILTNLFQEY